MSNVATGQVISYWFTYSLTGATTVDTGAFSYTVGDRRRHGRHADLHAGAPAPTPARRT